MKDINGNEFKVGCVFYNERDYSIRELLAFKGNKLVYWSETNQCSGNFPISYFSNPRILHYRELAPDKNGKMLCEGDTIFNHFGKERIAHGFILGYLCTSDKDGAGIGWYSADNYTFVSRPTDIPAPNPELEAIRKEVADAEAHLKSAQEKLSKVEKR